MTLVMRGGRLGLAACASGLVKNFPMLKIDLPILATSSTILPPSSPRRQGSRDFRTDQELGWVDSPLSKVNLTPLSLEKNGCTSNCKDQLN